MNKIKTVKIKNEDGTVSQESYYISSDARNIDMANGKNVQETIGTINVDNDGSIAEQLSDINDDIKKKAYFFDTVADMKVANLKNGDFVITLGYYEVNDGGAGEYKITNIENLNLLQESLSNGLYATLLFKDLIKSSQFGVKADNVTDNYYRLNKIFTFLQNYEPYCELVLDGLNVIKFSDTISVVLSNKKIIFETDLQLTKTVNLSENNALKGIKISGIDKNNLAENLIVEGNNHYIDGNGSNVTQNNSTTSGLYKATAISFAYFKNLIVKNLIIKNGYKDCIGVSDCKKVLIENCKIYNSYRDNGFSSGCSNVIPEQFLVKDCYAEGCRDLGFSTWHGKNIIFDNCIAYNCGNTGPTTYDSTYVSTGGGFSIEVASSSIASVDDTYNTTIRNCKIIECKNYGIYCNVGNAKIENIEIKNIYATDTTGLRAGYGIYCEEYTYPILIDNIKISSSIMKSALAIYNDSNVTTNTTIKNIQIEGNSYQMIVNIEKTKNLVLKNIIDNTFSNNKGTFYIIGYSSSNRNNEIYMSNIRTNNRIKMQNIDNVILSDLIMNYIADEDNLYPIELLKGTNVFLDGLFVLSNSAPDYAVRIGGSSSADGFNNIYEGIIKTNKTHTIDSTVHS